MLYLNCFLLGGCGAWLVMTYGKKLGLIDKPTGRSSHREPIPKGGGIGILVAVVFASVILSIPPGFWVPAVLLSGLSLWGGDKQRIGPINRLMCQFLISIALLISIYLKSDMNIVYLYLLFPALIFMVGTSNCYNFMDGIDGIAGITGIIGFLLTAYYTSLTGIGGEYRALSISIAFACTGFLCFNLPKAKVFLGDIGSILLGFLFSGLVLVLSRDVTDFSIMIGFLSTFYFDEIITMGARLKKGESLLRPHRKHIYQLLVNEFGIAHWKVSSLYGTIQLIVGVAIIHLASFGMAAVIIFYCLIGMSVHLFYNFLQKKFRR